MSMVDIIIAQTDILSYYMAMDKHIFILGQSSDIAKQELFSCLENKAKISYFGSNFAIVEGNINPKEVIKILGGTIKIAKISKQIDSLDSFDAQKWYDELKSTLSTTEKNNFGFSLYGSRHKYQQLTKTALEVKKIMKKNNYKARFVASNEPILSSVIVATNKLLDKELLFVPYQNKIILAFTAAVQDFKDYGQRDMNRPQTDDASGMLPPKVAKMMINIASQDKKMTILDPFCGSGTILQEAALLGFKKIFGSDKSHKAVDDSQANIEWLKNNYNINSSFKIEKIDVKNLLQKIKPNSIDLIVTEPYMGNAKMISRTKDINVIHQIKDELQQLYLESFRQFHKILSPLGKVVFVFPIFDLGNNKVYTLDENIIKKIDLKPVPQNIQSEELSINGNIIYMRPHQKVLREITIWQK